MKKLASLFLSVTMFLSLCTPALAVTKAPVTTDDLKTYVSTITTAKANELTADQLRIAACLATTDEQANIIFDALLDKVENGQISLTSVSDTYVSIKSAIIGSKTITVRYEIIAKVPSGAYLELGVQYPASTRMPAKRITLSTMSVGTYTEAFSVADVVAKQVYTKFTARDYTSTDVYKTFYTSTASTYDYHKLTAGEVVGYYTVVDIAPFVTALIFPEQKIVKIGGIVLEVSGISYTLANALRFTKDLPAPMLGQYYQTRTWYSANKLYMQIKVWDDEENYKNGEKPEYDSGAFVATTLPDF